MPLVPARSIPPGGWNGISNAGTTLGANSGGATKRLESGASSSPGGAFVWSDSTLTIGLIDTGIHTRILKDAAVILLAVALLTLGLILMAAPDLTQAVKTVTAALPEVAA